MTVAATGILGPTATRITDREALEYLGKRIVREGRGPLARDFVYGLSKNTSKNVLWALKPVVERCAYDLQSLAVQKLGKIPKAAR